jgi:hypothetical protein
LNSIYEPLPCAASKAVKCFFNFSGEEMLFNRIIWSSFFVLKFQEVDRRQRKDQEENDRRWRIVDDRTGQILATQESILLNSISAKHFFLINFLSQFW